MYLFLFSILLFSSLFWQAQSFIFINFLLNHKLSILTHLFLLLLVLQQSDILYCIKAPLAQEMGSSTPNLIRRKAWTLRSVSLQLHFTYTMRHKCQQLTHLENTNAENTKNFHNIFFSLYKTLLIHIIALTITIKKYQQQIFLCKKNSEKLYSYLNIISNLIKPWAIRKSWFFYQYV